MSSRAPFSAAQSANASSPAALAATSMPSAAPPAISPWRSVWLRARVHPGILLGTTLLAVVILAALFAPWLAPHDPYVQDLSARLRPPMWGKGGTATYVFGTDSLGRDYLSRILYGARVSLAIGFITVCISGAIGITLGLLAGYFGGWVDQCISYLITIRLTLPVVLVALVVVAVVGTSMPIVITVIGCLLWDRFVVVTRSATMQVARLEYVGAARAVGCSIPRILVREVLPNIGGSLVVVATVEMTHAILTEAALSFLGLGVQPPIPSWGLMVAESKQYFLFAPWVVIIPSLALFLLVLAINLLGDGLRDVTMIEGRT